MLKYSWIILLLLHSVLSQTTDKYSDEDRPYKFGFNIQGYQHRQEEKDEKGLIKGEYGFITADGYYRVTVYATDENGDFKILSMKNYYVGFPPEDPTTTPGPPARSSNARQPFSNPSFGRSQVPTGRALNGDDRSDKPAKSAFEIPKGLPGCSHCSIPTTTVRPNQNLLVDTGDFRSGRREGGSFGNFGQRTSGGQEPQFPQGSPRGNIQQGQQGQFPQGSPRRNNQQGQFPHGTPGSTSGGQGSQFPQSSPRTNNQQPSTGFENQNPSGPGSAFGGGNRQGPGAGLRSGPIGGTFGSGDSGFPRGGDGNQLGGTPRQRPQIGEVRDGLPPGVSIHDIKDLLYTFNYTVGFHGHHEDGYRNGDKLGDYFFDGRDGVERKVEYLANEFGFQPNITLIDLPENDVRRPNEQTEKEYGLKGYEFKWFYRK